MGENVVFEIADELALVETIIAPVSDLVSLTFAPVAR
jgi:hypothetical protein